MIVANSHVTEGSCDVENDFVGKLSRSRRNVRTETAHHEVIGCHQRGSLITVYLKFSLLEGDD
jgi:hypothetical protein